MSAVLHAVNTVHAVARVCRAAPQAALQHLSSAEGMARWTLGLWNTREVSPGLYTGASLTDGASGWVRVQVDAAGETVDYAVGATPDALVARIRATVVPGPRLGYAPDQVVVTLMAWRTAGMDDVRWARLVALHEVEIDLIRGQLESAAVPAPPPPARG